MLTSDEKTGGMEPVRLAMALCVVVLAAAGGAPGAEIYWDEPAGGAFNLDINWNPVQVPGADDTAIFDLGSAGYIVNFDTNVTNNSCHFHNDEVYMNLGGYTYTLTNTDKPLIVGDNVGDMAIVTMTDGTLESQNAHIGLWDDSIGVLIVGIGMTMNIGDSLVVGNDGDGNLIIEDDGSVTCNYLRVGAHNLGDTGRVEILGPDAILSVTTAFEVGYDGTGSVTVSDGATAKTTDASGWIVVGKNTGSEGEILVENGSLLDAEAAPIVIGGSGDGSLIVAGDSRAHSSGELFVAGEGSTGEVLITDESEYISDSVYSSKIGEKGIGTLTIEDGSLFQGYSMIIGDKLTGVGTVTLGDFDPTASDSTLDVDFLRVGRDGVGRLEVNDGRVVMGNIDPTTVPDGEVHVGDGGELGGTGAIACKVLNIAGEVRPGGTINPTYITGVLDIEGDFEQQAAGTLVIELGGTTRGDDYSALDVLGDVKLAGTLKVELIEGFQPSDGDTFCVLGWGARDGTFDAFDLPDLGSLSWNTLALYDTGEISVVPEPATLAMLCIGGLLALRRRKRN